MANISITVQITSDPFRILSRFSCCLPLSAHHVLLTFKLGLQTLQLFWGEDGPHSLRLVLLPGWGGQGATGAMLGGLLLIHTCTHSVEGVKDLSTTFNIGTSFIIARLEKAGDIVFGCVRVCMYVCIYVFVSKISQERIIRFWSPVAHKLHPSRSQDD